MATLVEKHGDNITRAINYIDEQLKLAAGKSAPQAISDAGAKFNLTPKDEEYLIRVFKNRNK